MERTGKAFIEDGVRRPPPPRADPDALLSTLQAISRGSAARLSDHPPLTDADLDGDDDLPA